MQRLQPATEITLEEPDMEQEEWAQRDTKGRNCVGTHWNVLIRVVWCDEIGIYCNLSVLEASNRKEP